MRLLSALWLLALLGGLLGYYALTWLGYRVKLLLLAQLGSRRGPSSSPLISTKLALLGSGDLQRWSGGPPPLHSVGSTLGWERGPDAKKKAKNCSALWGCKPCRVAAQVTSYAGEAVIYGPF